MLSFIINKYLAQWNEWVIEEVLEPLIESTGEQVISKVYSQFQQLIVYSHLGLSFK